MEKPVLEPLPTLLTAPDAMIYAADKLEEMVHHMHLSSSFYQALNEAGACDHPEHHDRLKEIKGEIATYTSGIKDIELQEQAMKAAAKAIRDLAHEQKIVESRAAKASASGDRVIFMGNK